MLGRSWGQARQGATRNSSQLQRCWRWVCTDMMGCESPATPSISASLCRRWQQSRINEYYLDILPSLLVYLGLICLFIKINSLSRRKCHPAQTSIRNSVKEGIGDSCGYTHKLDWTCITTCYHHLVIIFYSLSISLKDLHVCTGLGIKRSSHVWDSEKNANAPRRMRTGVQTLQRPQATIVSGGGWWGWDYKIHPLFLFFILFANRRYNALSRVQILVLLFLRVW